MGLSKRAKRGIGIFSHIQTETQGVKYMFPKTQGTMIDLNKIDDSVLQAGVEAIKIMRENANVQKLSESQNNAVTPDPKGGAQPSVPLQPENGEDRPEGTTPGAESGGGNQ